MGIVPANFQITFNVKDVGFHLTFGYDSRGLLPDSGGKTDLTRGIYVGAGADNPIFTANADLSVDLAVGADADIVEARTGIRGSLVADAKAYFPGNGAIHLDQFNTDCPLEGDATLTAKVSLFAAASLNLNLEALKKSLQHLVEFVVANNPYTFAAKKLLELPVVKNGLNYLKDQGVISQADLDHLYEYANDPNKAHRGDFRCLRQGRGTRVGAVQELREEPFEAIRRRANAMFKSDPTGVLQKGSDIIGSVDDALGNPFGLVGGETSPRNRRAQVADPRVARRVQRRHRQWRSGRRRGDREGGD